jgi:ubiquinone/menaquinone biosynthesis C-methylase UbiE
MSFVSPSSVVTALTLMPGQKIVDFGCGSGVYIEIAQPLLSGSGLIYAVDINKELLKSIKRDAALRTGARVEVIWTDIDKSFELPIVEHSIDAIIFSNVLSLLKHKEFVFRETTRILKENGVILVVDWTKEQTLVSVSHDSSFDLLVDLCSSSGYAQVRRIPAGDHHIAFIARREL